VTGPRPEIKCQNQFLVNGWWEGDSTFDELVAQETHGHRRLAHASISKNHLRGGPRPKIRCGRGDLEEERNEEVVKERRAGEEGKIARGKAERVVRCGEAPSVDDADSLVLYFYLYLYSEINDTQPRLKCVECCLFTQLLRPECPSNVHARAAFKKGRLGSSRRSTLPTAEPRHGCSSLH
jgi:hypothetical protein